MCLDRFHVTKKVKNVGDYENCYEPFMILDTIEKGRILFTHASHGEFSLSNTKVIELFNSFNCDCVITCHPGLVWQEQPELAKQLNILYPEFMGVIYNDEDYFYSDNILNMVTGDIEHVELEV